MKTLLLCLALLTGCQPTPTSERIDTITYDATNPGTNLVGSSITIVEGRASRFDNRGVSNNDNVLVFWLNNVEIKRLKINYGPNYEGVICGWLDRDLDIETLKERVEQVRENEITNNWEPPAAAAAQ